ncbi:MAG: enoyl-CoA hydratase-related protein [Pseudomonadota bacterium]
MSDVLPDGGTVRLTKEATERGVIAHLVIDHPARRNAMGPAVIQSLAEAAAGLAGDDDLRVVILRGSNGIFSAGANVKVMAGLDADSARTFITSLHKAIDVLRRLPVPVIAVLEGRCYGAAMELAAACDMRIADAAMIAGMPEVRVGIPSVIEACLLPRLIGWGKTSELLLTGRDLDAAEAKQIGFVEKVADSRELDGCVDEWAEMILSCAPGAVRSQKSVMRGWEQDNRKGIEASIQAFSDAFLTDEPARYLGPLAGKR